MKINETYIWITQAEVKKRIIRVVLFLAVFIWLSALTFTVNKRGKQINHLFHENHRLRDQVQLLRNSGNTFGIQMREVRDYVNEQKSRAQKEA